MSYGGCGSSQSVHTGAVCRAQLAQSVFLSSEIRNYDKQSIRFVETTVADKIEQVGALLQAHWLELATNRELMVLKPDAAKYSAMERAGLLLSLCVFDDDEMVGYSVNTIGRNLHYSDLVVSMNDVLFLLEATAGSLAISGSYQVTA
jgi:hypothetical protein